MKNILELGKAIVLAKITKKKIPLYVSLSVTSRCNSNCLYCSVIKKKTQEMTTEQILKLIEDMYKSGTRWLSFNGGEALLRKDIDILVNFAKKKGMFVSLFSNGYLVPQKIDLIRKLDCLVLSFDGKKEHHDLTRGKGSYDKVMRAILLVKSVTNIKLLTNTVITKYNLCDIDFILETAKCYGFFCKFNILYKSDENAQHVTRIIPTNGEYSDIIEKLIKEKRKGAPIVLSFKALKYMLDWEDFRTYYMTQKNKNKNKNKNKFKCLGGKLFCYIDTDGTVSPCIISKKFIKPLSCMGLGFETAFLNTSHLSCQECLYSACLGYNSMLSLDTNTILSGLQLLLK